METTLKLESKRCSGSISKISIDNSTTFKDFRINQEKKEMNLQISKSSTGPVCLEIGDFTLIGREVEMLKEFLNQL